MTTSLQRTPVMQQQNSKDAQDFLSRLDQVPWQGSSDFPLPSQAVIEFSAMSRRANVRIHELAKVVESESGLTAELLRNVNSSSRGLRSKVESVPQAIALLGTTNCTSVFLTKALDHALQSFESTLISNDDARRESLERARFAQEVARRIGLDPVLSFTAANLQDILLPLLTIKYKEEYTQYLASEESLGIAHFERATFGWTHAEVTAKTLRLWGFPDSLVLRVLLHHESPEELFISENADHQATPNAIAALLDDVMRQSPAGITRLVDLQRFHSKMKVLDLAETVDEKSRLHRLPGQTTVSLVNRLQCAMLEQVERRQGAAIAVGRKFGNYVLEKKLTESTTGSIFQAKHIMLRRPAAIKFLRADRMTSENVRQFEQEVQVTSTLRHPHTISIFDYGHTHDGLFYYAMELVNGVTLENLVRCTGPVPDGRVLQILLQVCGSLAEAHNHDLVHRDIKPPNIMVSQAVGTGDHATVLDFGLVTRQNTEVESGIRGTPQYMSPEAASGRSSIDSRSDLYSIAAVAYFLLTGKPLFEGDVYDVLKQQVDFPPIPLQAICGSNISADLATILMQALEKSPDSRPQSAIEMMHSLAACQPVQEWLPEDSLNWWSMYGSIAMEMSPLAKVACEETLIVS